MNARICFLGAVLACASATTFAADGDPTPRRSMDPHDHAKVQQIKAQRWMNFGANDNAVSHTDYQGAGSGSKGCTTNIGSTPASAPRAGEASGRYGPQPRQTTVIVTGSVINACK
jgi:hypothetical protein